MGNILTNGTVTKMLWTPKWRDLRIRILSEGVGEMGCESGGYWDTMIGFKSAWDCLMHWESGLDMYVRCSLLHFSTLWPYSPMTEARLLQTMHRSSTPVARLSTSPIAEIDVALVAVTLKLTWKLLSMPTWNAGQGTPENNGTESSVFAHARRRRHCRVPIHNEIRKCGGKLPGEIFSPSWRSAICWDIIVKILSVQRRGYTELEMPCVPRRIRLRQPVWRTHIDSLPAHQICSRLLRCIEIGTLGIGVRLQ